MENKIPLSSTYKKIKKLQRSGLVRIQKYEFNDTGKKVLLYRASFEFKMERGRLHISQALTSSLSCLS
jgi:predicted transcriptional regulator